MSDKHFVGLDVINFSDNGLYPKITSVTLQKDTDNSVTAGETSGMEMYAICPYATQDMVTALLMSMRYYQYQAYEAVEANIDPAAELGDGIDVGGVYSVIARITDKGNGYPDISAPGEVELEDEYPTVTANRSLTDDTASLRAYVVKALGEMQIELQTMKGQLNTLSTKVDNISAAVTALEQRVTKLEGGS